MNHSVIFGERLQLARRRCGIRQYQLADELGIARRTLTRWENGQAGGINLEALVAIAKRLGVSVDYLLGLTDHE